jgi:hypothetical protein
MTNTELFNQAQKAIDELFKDSSVRKSETESNLKSLMFNLQVLLDELETRKDAPEEPGL